jgi:hypothetical protein
MLDVLARALLARKVKRSSKVLYSKFYITLNICQCKDETAGKCLHDFMPIGKKGNKDRCRIVGSTPYLITSRL